MEERGGRVEARSRCDRYPRPRMIQELDLVRETGPSGAGSGDDEMARLRHQYLERQFSALVGAGPYAQGRASTFDEESGRSTTPSRRRIPNRTSRTMLDRLEKRFPARARSSSATTRSAAPS